MSMYETPARSDELYHYGVIGMKWGVRRYQPYTKKLASGNYGQEVGLAAKRKTAKKLVKAHAKNESELAKAEAYTEKKRFKAEKAKAKHPGSASAARAERKAQATESDLKKLKEGMSAQETYLSKKHEHVHLTSKEQDKWDRQQLKKARKQADALRKEQVKNSILMGEEELDKLKKRIDNENDLRNYNNKRYTTKGKEFTNDILNDVATTVVTGIVLKQVVYPAIKKKLKVD